MNKYTQALELCIAARMTYNTCRLSLKKQYGAPIIGQAVAAIDEPFIVLSIPPAQARVIKDTCLRIERGELKNILRNQNGLACIYMLNHFLNTLQKKYLNIPEGSHLWEATHAIFRTIENDVITEAESMKASYDGKRLAEKILTYFQSKGLYKDA